MLRHIARYVTSPHVTQTLQDAFQNRLTEFDNFVKQYIGQNNYETYVAQLETKREIMMVYFCNQKSTEYSKLPAKWQSMRIFWVWEMVMVCGDENDLLGSGTPVTNENQSL
jgi:hypothetical protein